MTELFSAAECRLIVSGLANALATQDNVSTEHPLYTVQEERPVYGLEYEYRDARVWTNGERTVTEESDPELWKRLELGEECPDDRDDPEREWESVGVLRQWVHVQSFLTMAAAISFRVDQAHNLGKTRIYVESGHRNPEWKLLRALITNLARLGAPKNDTTTRFYTVRSKKFCSWARIWLTNDGCLSMITDYGNYGHWWTHPGCEIRRFLVRADHDYIEGKFADGEKEYDGEATYKNVKTELLRYRREKYLTKEEARDELELLERHEKLENEHALHLWYEETKLPRINSDLHELFSYTRPSQLRHFMKVLWPLFIEQLEGELQAESEAATDKMAREVGERAPVEAPQPEGGT